MTNPITAALTNASTIGIIHGPSVSREVNMTLEKFSSKYPKGWLVLERSPLKNSLMVDREYSSINMLLEDCDVLAAFPVLECPQALLELPPSLIQATTPWEAMANALRLEIPTVCWSNADFHQPPPWLVPMGGGWWRGRRTTLF
jgi:hypothetical protein